MGGFEWVSANKRHLPVREINRVLVASAADALCDLLIEGRTGSGDRDAQGRSHE